MCGCVIRGMAAGVRLATGRLGLAARLALSVLLRPCLKAVTGRIGSCGWTLQPYSFLYCAVTVVQCACMRATSGGEGECDVELIRCNTSSWI